LITYVDEDVGLEKDLSSKYSYKSESGNLGSKGSAFEKFEK